MSAFLPDGQLPVRESPQPCSGEAFLGGSHSRDLLGQLERIGQPRELTGRLALCRRSTVAGNRSNSRTGSNELGSAFSGHKGCPWQRPEFGILLRISKPYCSSCLASTNLIFLRSERCAP